jgi:hypothetical protein
MNKIFRLLCLRFVLLSVSMLFFISNNSAQQTTKNKAAWMRHVKYGVLVHYLDFLQNARDPWNMGKRTSWDSCVNEFDVNLFAKQMHDIDAGYVVFTIQQGTKYMCMPNPTFEKLTGYKRGEATSHRDLVIDLYNALHKYNIRLMLYVTGDGSYKDPHSSTILQNPILKWKENKNNFIATETWVNNWAKVLKDISIRYGNKISGWWVDGTYRFHGFNDTLLGTYSVALKAGNSNSLVAFNASPQKKVMFYSKWDDYTAGEMDVLTDYPPKGGKLNGIQWHESSYLGKRWQQPGVRFKSDYLINYLNKVNDLHGVVTLEVCLLRNGSIDSSQYAFLKQVSGQIKKR